MTFEENFEIALEKSIQEFIAELSKSDLSIITDYYIKAYGLKVEIISLESANNFKFQQIKVNTKGDVDSILTSLSHLLHILHENNEKNKEKIR